MLRSQLEHHVSTAAGMLRDSYDSASQQLAAGGLLEDERIYITLPPEIKLATRRKAVKALVRHHLLLQLHHVVWDSQGHHCPAMLQQLRQQLQQALPAFQLRQALLLNAPLLHPVRPEVGADEDGSSPAAPPVADSSIAWQAAALNKLLDAQRQISRQWYHLLEGDAGDRGAIGGAATKIREQQLEAMAAVKAIAQPFLDAVLGTGAGVASMAGGEGVEAIEKLLLVAVKLRLAVEACHPCQVVQVTAGTAPQYRDAAVYEEAVSAAVTGTAVTAQQLAAVGEVPLVIGCHLPGIAVQQELMLGLLAAEGRGGPQRADQQYVVVKEECLLLQAPSV